MSTLLRSQNIMCWRPERGGGRLNFVVPGVEEARDGFGVLANPVPQALSRRRRPNRKVNDEPSLKNADAST